LRAQPVELPVEFGCSPTDANGLSIRTPMSSDVQRNEKGQVEEGSGGALGATSARRAGISQIARLRALIEPEREAIVAKLIETAKGGTKEGVRAAEILLDRLAARPRPTAELVRIEGLATAQIFQAKCDAVVIAVAHGEVSADAGRSQTARWCATSTQCTGMFRQC